MTARRCAARIGIGMRQINLLLIPSAAFLMVLATPDRAAASTSAELHAHSTELVSEALFWFALSLPVRRA